VKPASKGEPPRFGLWRALEDQFGIAQLIRDYMIPVETNSIWYLLGGVLAISLALEILTGILLSLVYAPDAGRAFSITAGLLRTRGWNVILNFHYWNAFLIFGLVMVHMLRVFFSGGYLKGKQGLWMIGVVLAGLTFLVSVTGETLHWDEVGFAVPWHASEMLQAFGLAGFFQYTFADLRNVTTATLKLGQVYAAHIAIVPILLLLFIVWHYYLIRLKGISLPFWLRATGGKAPFSEHVRGWLIYGGIILGVVLLIAIFVPRDAGIIPQLLPSSPFFGSTHGPGFLGTKPTFPISWTHGMNVFVGEHLGIEPDIWGTMIGMALMLVSLFAIPFLDRSEHEPSNLGEAFDWRKRGCFSSVRQARWRRVLPGLCCCFWVLLQRVD
jgi:quinol-cytochrome oxidoreductase complex cytochrome b subunit